LERHRRALVVFQKQNLETVLEHDFLNLRGIGGLNKEKH
jgi:hypothetical protein